MVLKNLDTQPIKEGEIEHEYIKESRIFRQEKIQLNKKHRKYRKNMTKKSPQIVKVEKTDKQQKEKVGEEIKPKLKNQLQMMYTNLSKIMRKEGIFIEASKSYENIYLRKDYNLQIVGLNNKEHKISVRAEVAIWKEFRKIVTETPNDFSRLKDEFVKWSKEKIQKFNPNQEVQSVFDKYMSIKDLDKRAIKFLPKLENRILNIWRKPGKQPRGFLERSNEIYDLWTQEIKEINHIEQIENELNFESYEDSFPLARSLKRKITIIIGPTNSGKTFHALNELAKGKTGLYLAPLRLMAAEGQEALAERGIVANLITGEEKQIIEGATHTSSTVEMCQFNKVVDAAIIDEIQMIADPSRGWAWSQALIGVSAKHVILVGSEESLPFIIPVIEALNEEYEIKTLERKTPLNYRDPMFKLKDLRNGDCVVVFSRKSALEMKSAIEAEDKKCSVIYGNLSPEVRRAEAAKFKSGENGILVATDAIGMGLNLPIKRIFFSTLEKFDGNDMRKLSVSEIKQIAGRAGRYGFSDSGDVGVLFDNSVESRNLLHKAIYLGYEKAEDTRISIAPNLEQIKTICEVLGKEDLYSALIFFKEKLIKNHDIYKTANLEAMIEIAALIKSKKLPIEQGFTYCCVPIDLNSDPHTKMFNRWINNHIHGELNLSPELPEQIGYPNKVDSFALYEVENYVKLCMCYRWLHYRYPDIYCDEEMVTINAGLANDYIEKSLTKRIVINKNPKWRR